MSKIESLRKEISRLQRLNSEWCEIYDRIDVYCERNVNLRLGSSKVDTLIDEHKEMKERLKEIHHCANKALRLG